MFWTHSGCHHFRHPRRQPPFLRATKKTTSTRITEKNTGNYPKRKEVTLLPETKFWKYRYQYPKRKSHFRVQKYPKRNEKNSGTHPWFWMVIIFLTLDWLILPHRIEQ